MLRRLPVPASRRALRARGSRTARHQLPSRRWPIRRADFNCISPVREQTVRRSPEARPGTASGVGLWHDDTSILIHITRRVHLLTEQACRT